LFGGGAFPQGQAFDDALVAAVVNSNASGSDHAGRARQAALANWAKLPGARDAHPREEHLLPLLVCAGAAGDDAAEAIDRGGLYGVAKSAFVFGGTPSQLV
jgi:aromatic ring-opening dioxygenase catalytic subunit (LigB family)